MSAVKTNGLTPSKPSGGGLWLRLRRWVGTIAWGAYRGDNPGILIGAMLVLIAIFAYLLRDTEFISPVNLLSIVRVSTTITIMSIAIVFVLCAGEIDLSIASIVPVAALITALLLSWDYNFVLAALIGVLFGAGVGFLNGLAVVFFRIPSFVVTLGSMGIMQGLAQIVTNASTVSIANDPFFFWFGGGSVGSIPILAFWSLGALIIGSVILSRTAMRRRVLATGANAAAARFSGIRTGRVKVGVLTASGAAGGLAGVLYDGQYAAANFTIGANDLLSVISAAIIGGAALEGGKGTVLGAVAASLLVGTLNNALVLIGFGAPQQVIVQGVIIVAAVVVSSRPGGDALAMAGRARGSGAPARRQEMNIARALGARAVGAGPQALALDSEEGNSPSKRRNIRSRRRQGDGRGGGSANSPLAASMSSPSTGSQASSMSSRKSSRRRPAKSIPSWRTWAPRPTSKASSSARSTGSAGSTASSTSPPSWANSRRSPIRAMTASTR